MCIYNNVGGKLSYFNLMNVMLWSGKALFGRKL